LKAIKKVIRKIVNSYKKISEVIIKFARKKFPQSCVFNILKRNNLIPPNEVIIKHNISNL